MKKNQWKLRRQFLTSPEAQHRWDRVYQNLLHWTQYHASQQAIKPVAKARQEE